MSFRLSDIPTNQPLVFDGAMGTMLQSKAVKCACNEELCLLSPDVIGDIHLAYLRAGSNVIMTNTFGANSITLSDYGLEGKVAEINRAAVACARRAIAVAGGKRRFIAGDLGPTSKLPTLGHVSFEKLFRSYSGQIEVLSGEGVDLLIIETCQDPLQAKAALAAAGEVFEKTDLRPPVIVSVTIQQTGTMLLGTEIGAALSAVAPYKPMAFGLNCAVGPAAMAEHLSYLAKNSPFPIICQPNAGIPENVDGQPRYPLDPEGFAQTMADFVRRFGLSFVGGCCGTTPSHIAALVRELERITGAPLKTLMPAARGKKQTLETASPAKSLLFSPGGGNNNRFLEVHLNHVSSLYTSISLDQEPRPFIVAEQTNVNGSRGFKKLLLDSDFDAMAEQARKAAASSHALDICLAYPGRDEPKDYAEFVSKLVLKADAALMIDSMSPDAIESALSRIPGRAIINSVNLEDGGTKAKRVFSFARRFGAAVVGLTIDEKGMAKDVDTKVDIAKRLVKFAMGEGIGVNNLIIDPLTFTLASGDAELRGAGAKTLAAVSRIKREITGVRTILGVSNISYGLSRKGRRFLTAVFLHRAVAAGLDVAIINPASIIPLGDIPKDAALLCDRLIDWDDCCGDPLDAFLKYCTGDEDTTVKPAGPAPSGAGVGRLEVSDPARALYDSVIDGSREGIDTVIEKLLTLRPAADVMNAILLPAMEEVGRRFGAGTFPLPFVLQSAEVMRLAVDRVAQHMPKDLVAKRGTIILATVRGDVHDIGKNLVDVVLSNNGFRVVNLGIRQAASAIIEAAKANKADAVGLSGLLVSSTEIMREDLEIFKQHGLSIPVLCGGAALNRGFVERCLQPVYGGRVYYCADVFAGLEAMREIV